MKTYQELGESYNIDKDVVEEIKDLEPVVADLVAPPFQFSELVKTFEELGDVVAKSQGMTKTKAKEILGQLWNYYDEKYQVVSFLDDLIALPALVEPFDGPAISAIVKYVILPLSVKWLPIPD